MMDVNYSFQFIRLFYQQSRHMISSVTFFINYKKKNILLELYIFSTLMHTHFSKVSPIKHNIIFPEHLYRLNIPILYNN